MKEINLVEILKDAPEGTKLYSTAYGEVEFMGVDGNFLQIKAKDGHKRYFTSEGWFFNNYDDAECLLFPSKSQRDWSKFVPDLPIGSLVACWDKNDESIQVLRYAGEGRATLFTRTNGGYAWDYIIPISELTNINIYENKVMEPEGKNYGKRR